MGIEPTTSGLDLPSLCRLSYKVAQRKSGTILDGESRRRESKGTYECCANPGRPIVSACSCPTELISSYVVEEPRSTRDIEILFKLIVKVPAVGNTADTPNPPGLLPLQRKFGSPHGPKKI